MFCSPDQLRQTNATPVFHPGPVWSFHLWHSRHGGCWNHVRPQEELLCDRRGRPAFCLHHCPWAWWAPPTLILKYTSVLQPFLSSECICTTDTSIGVFWHLVPRLQDTCSTCPTTTWRPARTCLANCRTTTWCLPHLFRSTAPAPGPTAVLPSSLNFWTVGTVSFHNACTLTAPQWV